MFLIYQKLNTYNNKQVSIMADPKEIDKLDKINLNLKKINNTISLKSRKNISKLELKTFDTNMIKFKGFLDQSKIFKKNDMFEGLYIINTKAGSIEDEKIFFLTEFTKLIFSNGLTFKDLKIDNDYYDYGPLEVNFVWFDIDNIKEIKDGGDYKVYEADVIFTLKDKTKKILKYEFYDNRIEELDKSYKKFQFIDYEREAEPYLYSESYKLKGKYRIILNDLFQYLDFIGKNFYNKNFIQWDFLRYNYESLLTNDYGEYKDLSWQVYKNNFTYVDKIAQNKEVDILDNISDDELFIYTLKLYYKEYNNFELKEKIFKVTQYLDELIEKKYGMAYIVKAILYIDGKIILKDYEEAKILLKEAYQLGLYTPSMMVWNENRLYEK